MPSLPKIVDKGSRSLPRTTGRLAAGSAGLLASAGARLRAGETRRLYCKGRHQRLRKGRGSPTAVALHG